MSVDWHADDNGRTGPDPGRRNRAEVSLVASLRFLPSLSQTSRFHVAPMAHHVKPIKPQPPRDKIYLQAGDPDRAEQFERFLQTSSRQPFVSQVGKAQIGRCGLRTHTSKLIECHIDRLDRLELCDLGRWPAAGPPSCGSSGSHCAAHISARVSRSLNLAIASLHEQLRARR